jgi:hypothetical protein
VILLVTKALPSLDRYRCPFLGRLVTPRHWSNVPGMVSRGIEWAADNDAFNGFDETRFTTMLDGIEGAPGCRFVTCPDVVADAAGTLALLDRWEPILRARGLPVGFVGQDGLEDLEVPWDRIDAFFIGGSTEWKLGPAAAGLAAEAKRRDLWVHMGRVNSAKRIRYAHSIGCDSVDGSGYARFYDTHVPDALRLLADLEGMALELPAVIEAQLSFFFATNQEVSP